MAQGQVNQAETPVQTQVESEPIEAWLLKKVFKIASIVDASVTVIPRENGVRLEALSNDRIALVAVDVDWFKPPYGFIIDAYDVGKIMRGLPWSRLLVRVLINGRSFSIRSVDGAINATVDIVEKPEGIMDGVLKHLNEGVKAVMRVDAFKLWSWFKPFAVVGEGRAHFKMMFGGFIIDMMNEDAPMMLDVKGSLLEYESDNIFEVGYYLGYTTSFLEEVKRNGNVTVIIAQDKPMVIEANLERGIVARIAQAPMVE